MKKLYFTQKGFTLIEVIVVTTLFTILMLVIMNSIASLYRANAYTISQSYQIFNARRAVQTMARDVREMTFADDGTFPLARMEDHLIGFYSDIDRDDSVEYVEYELATTTILTKRVYDAGTGTPAYDTTTADATFILSEYMQNSNQATSTFYYFDTNGDPASATTSVVDIRFIQMQAIINVDPVRDPGQFMLRAGAALRNVLDNV
ncbi:MAG: prepilin-type N-terminal cleavage/methylation domain-containing protein [Patiriisocius sp.]|jgi:prepilin-type N-terminal cleavage/methylation domain-containing protein